MNHSVPETSGMPAHLKMVEALLYNGVVGSGKTQFAIFQFIDLRLRGACRQIIGLPIQDGAGIAIGH